MGLSREGNVAALYDRWAARYDAAANRTRDLAAEALRAMSPAAGTVVELGCGTGGNTAWLAQSAGAVVAMDFSEEMLVRARARLPAARVGLVRQDLRDGLPLADACADVVVITLVLEHVERLAPVVTECARVLRPGGELRVCEYHPYRQLRGGQARFALPEDVEEVRIPAFLHMLSEHVEVGLGAGLVLAHLGEWREAGAAPDAPPRVLSLRWTKPDAAA